MQINLMDNINLSYIVSFLCTLLYMLFERSVWALKLLTKH